MKNRKNIKREPFTWSKFIKNLGEVVIMVKSIIEIIHGVK